MAPPKSRLSGHSKKAQYSVFTGYLLAGLGALIGAALLVISLAQPTAFSTLRGGAAEIVRPVGEATSVARSSNASIWERLSAYYRAGSQNVALREEVELARIRLAEAESVAQENERLKSLLSLSESEIEPVAVSRIVGSSSSSSRRFAYLGVGRNAGITPGMPVRSPRGVIGRVLETSGNTSRILLLTDSESVLPVRRASDETVAFAEGRGDGLLRIRLINLGINPLELGDLFVTSGVGGYYRPGVAVAILTERTQDGGLARLVADPSGTDFVSIEPISQTEAVRGAETPAEQDLGQ